MGPLMPCLSRRGQYLNDYGGKSCLAYIGVGNLDLAVVKACGVYLHEDVFGTQFVWRWNLDVCLVLQGLLKALLSGEDPLSGHYRVLLVFRGVWLLREMKCS